ncbi:hypothetical protein F511_07144 [Dorcoceras hygrometricum]|nr:hypothetical protein F511_07144 [Dorcoceras hygrometricum]
MTSAFLLEESGISEDDVSNISKQNNRSAEVKSAESVDGSAMMMSAVMSSQSAVSYSTSPKGNQQIATMIQSKSLQDQRLVYQLQEQAFKLYRYHQLDNHTQAPLPSYCNKGEPAVARSVVTKKRQQLSEQLLNNLLEHIQLLGCNQRSRWKESMTEIESCKCLKSRGQDLYYSGK